MLVAAAVVIVVGAPVDSTVVAVVALRRRRRRWPRVALLAHGRTPFRAAIAMALVDVAMLVWAR